MPFDLKKAIPKPGNRFALPNLFGSGDAYALAQTAIEFPPMQKGASFNLQAVKEQVEAAIAKGKPGD